MADVSITNFSSGFPSGIKVENSGASVVSTPESLVMTLSNGGYSRVTRTDTILVKGSEYWAMGELVVPVGYFPNSSWSFRIITIDNWNQDTVTPTRLAVHVRRDGTLSIISNRGDAFIPLLDTGFKLPLGVKNQVVFRVKLSNVAGEALSELYVNGNKIATTTAPNIDSTDVFARIRIGVDGAAGAVSKTITYYKMFWGQNNPMLDRKAILQAELVKAEEKVSSTNQQLLSAQAAYVDAVTYRDSILAELARL